MGEREAVVVSMTLPFSTRTVTTTSPMICRFHAVRGYSGVRCADATVSAGIPTTTIGCISAACNSAGVEQSVTIVTIAKRQRLT
jgi:hypothetical protein